MLKLKDLPPACRKIIPLAKPYYRRGRENDELHHMVVAEIMSQLLKEYKEDSEIMLAAALLHDIGYSGITEKERRRHWDHDVRRKHMEAGAEIASKILSKTNFPKEKISTVVQLVATHDNPELGIPLTANEQIVLKEADLLWMTTEEAFWLDVKRRPNLTPVEWFRNLEELFEKQKQYLRSDFSHRQIRKFLAHMKIRFESTSKN